MWTEGEEMLKKQVTDGGTANNSIGMIIDV
jgi:hypothetical protein